MSSPLKRLRQLRVIQGRACDYQRDWRRHRRIERLLAVLRWLLFWSIAITAVAALAAGGRRLGWL